MGKANQLLMLPHVPDRDGDISAPTNVDLNDTAGASDQELQDSAGAADNADSQDNQDSQDNARN